MVIRFLTFNIWHGKNWQRVIEFIKAKNPDIFTLQEVTINITKHVPGGIDLKEEFKQTFAPNYKGVYAPINEKIENGKRTGFGNMIFSKFPILDYKVHYLLKSLGWADNYEEQSRNLLEVKINIDNQSLSVFTTHLAYSPKFVDTSIKLEEAKKIVRIVKNKENFILAGDFNATPNTEVIATIKSLGSYIDSKNRPTWTKHPFSYKGFKVNRLAWKLDYIFLSPNLYCKKLDIPDIDISDHLPLIAEIKI